MTTQNRIIRVKSCAGCPFNGECSAWKKLTKQQKVFLTLSNSVPVDTMLKDCPLEEGV